LVPVSRKIHVSECNVFHGERAPNTFPEKSCLDTTNIVGGKINFLILLKGK